MIASRLLIGGLLCLGLFIITSPGRADPQDDRNKQLADLEKQLAELQAKLKILRETPIPKKLTPAEEIIPEAWVNKFAWRSIGPATMGGRITGLAVYEADPTTYWVATATGGLLKTTNNGINFEIQFDHETTNSIGAVVVAPSNKEIVWVGTGENNPRNSVSWGDGVYKSVNGGKTWTNMGLKSSFQIGAIAIHPKTPDVVYVGALGRLYGPGGTRGLFKTEDGGKSWRNVLPQIDEKTGVIDIIMSPHQSETLIVAAWERQRDEFDSFRGDAKVPAGADADAYAPSVGHGPGSTLYKTIDGGKTWTKLVKGLPTVKMGRIGLDWSRKTPNTVFAIIDTENGGNGVHTGGVYKSADGGESWTRVNSINLRPSYFSVMRVDPSDDDTLYVLGQSLARSTDGGKTFTADKINAGVHPGQHALWINPKDSRHLIVGTDGGFYVTHDKCGRWAHMNHAFALGQFYHVAADTRKPYRVYGGSLDNGSWGGLSQTTRWPESASADWGFVNGEDGFAYCADPKDPDLLYARSQNGALMRRDLRTNTVVFFRPRSGPGTTAALRFNRNTPFLLSSHNSAIYYAAGNYVFKSVKQGDDLQVASPEITRTKRGTATTLSESPKNADVVWVGTDDGAVWLTKDGCKTWTNLTEKFKAAGLPGHRWVNCIEASKWAEGRAYVVFDAHRSDDETPYVFVTEDFGQTWKSITANLPTGSTRVLREDIVNPNLLYLGTEFAAFASVNRGAAWTKINGAAGLPTVAVHEFAQPVTANDLVVATHGRSVWVLDVTPLRQMTPEILKGKTSLMIPSSAIQWQSVLGGSPFGASARRYAGQNPPRIAHFDYTIFGKPNTVGIKVLDVTAKRRTPYGSGLGKVRWVAERTIGWLHNFRKLRVVTEKTQQMQLALLNLGLSLICFGCFCSS
ncbi:WD40/YVTN/BNR-like repeat-containing protein [Zavarzinella formosa]|uniref:WD40/YVTN/BNR-like repeat-containing protein n=1 Tax=Zavarzinella formosa TaxID=360055 RepID=UPI0002F1EC3C